MTDRAAYLALIESLRRWACAAFGHKWRWFKRSANLRFDGEPALGTNTVKIHICTRCLFIDQLSVDRVADTVDIKDLERLARL